MQPGFFLLIALNRKEVIMILIAGMLGLRLLFIIFEWRQIEKEEITTVGKGRVIHPAEFPMR